MEQRLSNKLNIQETVNKQLKDLQEKNFHNLSISS